MSNLSGHAAAALVGIALLTACPKNTPPPPEAPEGWQTVGDLACFYPPVFDGETNEIRRKDLRSTTWSELARGFRGEVAGGTAMDADALMDLELVLLGHPERIEAFSQDALQRCEAAAQGAVARYVAWLDDAAGRLSATDCNRGLIYEVHDFLEATTGWQHRLHMCKDDRIRIEVSGGGALYTVWDTGNDEDTPWIGVLGGLNSGPAPDSPCPDCRAGELLLRFEVDNGGTIISPFYPVDEDAIAQIYADTEDTRSSLSVEFVATDHGFISFAVNDSTDYDNRFRDANGYVEILKLHITPVIGEGEMYLGD